MAAALQIKDLKAFGHGNRLLLEVASLQIEKGERVGISGPSGAGKSTLLLALSGILENLCGQIIWNDKDFLRLSTEKKGLFRSLNMGMIFQDFLLFEELSAVENVLVSQFYFPNKAQPSRSEAERHLSRLGISQFDENVASFSGGERQRVAIARALVNDAPFILADEPTASLSREAADQLTDDLVTICKDGGKTLIVVSHDQHLLKKMDRVLTVTDGRIISDTGVQS
jgi:ABC-type lipoprotein export system ATPase subunit